MIAVSFFKFPIVEGIEPVRSVWPFMKSSVSPLSLPMDGDIVPEMSVSSRNNPVTLPLADISQETLLQVQQSVELVQLDKAEGLLNDFFISSSAVESFSLHLKSSGE